MDAGQNQILKNYQPPPALCRPAVLCFRFRLGSVRKKERIQV